MTPLRYSTPVAAMLLMVLLIGWFHAYPIGLALALLPLVAALPGLLRGKRYTAAWTSMLSLAYIALGMTEAVASPASRVWAYAVMLTSAALFLSCVLYVRRTRSVQ